MLVKDIMTPAAKWVDAATPIADAALIMRERDFGVLPVGDGTRLIGIVTDRDIAVRGAAEKRDLAASTVRDIMTDHVLYCFDDQLVEDVAANMAEQRVRRLAVLNREKNLVGMVTLGDIAARGPDQAAARSLAEISSHTRAAAIG